MNRAIAVFLFAFLFTGLAFSQTNLGDFTMRGAATIQVPGEGLTAYHPYLPLNSTAVITNPVSGAQVEVTIAGRIDPSHSRIIDLSRSAAASLGIRSGDNIILTVLAPTRRDPRERQAQLVEFTGLPIPPQQNQEPQQIIQYHTYEAPHVPQQQQQPEPKPEPVVPPPQPQYQPPSEPQHANGNGNGNGKSTEIYILPHPPQEDDGGITEFLAWLMAMSMDAREAREVREVREIRDAREARLNREAREMREIRENQEIREIREAREARELREVRDSRESREAREIREAREAREAEAARIAASAVVNPNQRGRSRNHPGENENAAQQPAKNTHVNQSPVKVPQAPINSRSINSLNLPPTEKELETHCIDLNTLAPISNANPNNTADFRVSANQTHSLNNQMPPVKPEALQILPGLPDRHSNKAYSLQVGSFTTLEAANRAASFIRDVGFDVKIEYSGAVYRVMAVKIASSDVYTASVRLGTLGFAQIWVRE